MAMATGVGVQEEFSHDHEATRGEFSTVLMRTDQEFVEAVRTGDAERAAALYTPDAKFMPPDAPSIEGRSNIRAVFEAYLHAGWKDMSIKTIESQVLSDSEAYSLGETTFWSTAADPRQPDDVLTCKYLLIWTKLDGQWLIHRDIYNNDPR
jgi:uncharacterized protein (TIGR02246 family)